jgi:hypothetical protein
MKNPCIDRTPQILDNSLQGQPAVASLFGNYKSLSSREAIPIYRESDDAISLFR